MTTDVVPVGLTPEQHAERADAVGASEVHEALFQPAKLWLRKTGREPAREDDALSRLGNMIEPYIIGEYQHATGRKVWAKPGTVRAGRMVAHLDGIADDPSTPGRVVECKWRGQRDGWGDPGSSDIPLPILLQVQQQMALANLPHADVPVLFLRPPIAIYTVAFDVELFAMMREGVERFWHWVETDTPPDVDPERPEAIELLRRLYPGTDGTRIQAPRALEHWRSVAQDSAVAAKEYEHVADVAKAHLLAIMREAAELEFADGTVLRRKVVNRKGYTVDATTFIEARFIKAKE